MTLEFLMALMALIPLMTLMTSKILKILMIVLGLGLLVSKTLTVYFVKLLPVV